MTIQYRQGLRSLTDISRRVMQVVDVELDDAAQEIKYLAQELVPVDTGHLRSTINVVRFDALSLQVRADAHYAAFVEYGTSRMAAQPYMTPAVEAIWPRVAHKVEQALNGKL